MNLITTKLYKYVEAGTYNYEYCFFVFNSFDEAYNYMIHFYNYIIENSRYSNYEDELQWAIENKDVQIGEDSFWIYDTGYGPAEIDIYTIDYNLIKEREC